MFFLMVEENVLKVSNINSTNSYICYFEWWMKCNNNSLNFKSQSPSACFT
jgi:hypothetical protein